MSEAHHGYYRKKIHQIMPYFQGLDYSRIRLEMLMKFPVFFEFESKIWANY